MVGDSHAEMSRHATEPASVPWVLIGGGFHSHGGMDKANAAMARFSIERGTPLHLVTHQVADEFVSRPRVVVHLIARPGTSDVQRASEQRLTPGSINPLIVPSWSLLGP